MTIKQAMQLDRAAKVIHVQRTDSPSYPYSPRRLDKIVSTCRIKGIELKHFERSYDSRSEIRGHTPDDHRKLKNLSTALKAEGVPEDLLDNEKIHHSQHKAESCFYVQLTSGDWKKFNYMSDHKQHRALSKLLAPKTRIVKNARLCIAYIPLVLGAALARSPM